MKFYQSGRSMVEMLGVLAIIGVLSVGAISGYSKAMLKYKLNKQAEAFNMLINYGLQYIGTNATLGYSSGTVTYYNTIFNKLGLIPDGIHYVSNDDMRDIFNNSIVLYYNNESDGNIINQFGGLGYRFDPSDQGAEICRNIVNVAKDNRADLWLIETYIHQTTNSSLQGNIYGDQYCTNAVKCLRDLSLNDIDALCNVCNGTSCQLFILWK